MITGLDPKVTYSVIVHATTVVGGSASDAVIVEAVTIWTGKS